MDFRDWKKMSEDGKTCTLTHPKGHKMTIALSAISKIQREQLKRLKMADGGEVSDDSDDSSQGKAADAAPTPITINVGTPNAQGASGAAPAPSGALPPMAWHPDPAKPGDSGQPGFYGHGPRPSSEQEGSDQNLLMSDKTLDAPAAVGLQQKAIGQQVPIESAKSEAVAKAEGRYNSDLESVKQAQANSYNELKGHADDFAQYIQDHPINPRAYQENMSTGSKIASGIGLFLGGLSVPYGGHNYAYDFLNKQIDRDIDAQKTRADQQKTVWGAYKDLYGDSNIATGLAKVSMNDMLVHSVNQAAAQLGTAQAIQKANELKSQKAIENHQILLDTSGRLGTLRTGGGAPGAGASNGKPNSNKEQGSWDDDHILAPNANQIANGLQFNKLAQPNLAGIMEQKQKADLADKALQTLKDAFPKVSDEAQGSNSIYARQHLGKFLGSFPFVGGPLKETVDTFTDVSPTVRKFESDKSTITGAIRGALQGNVSDELLDSTVEANLPQKGDSPELLKKKYQNFRDFIKSHTRTDLLRQYGLSRK